PTTWTTNVRRIAASGPPIRPMLLPSGGGHELVEAGPRLLADGAADGRCPAEQQALETERLTRPAVEVEAVALLRYQPVCEPELRAHVVDDLAPGLSERVVRDPARAAALIPRLML